MLVIGLSGGTEAKREAVARRINEASGEQFAVWAINGTRLGDGRARSMARALEGANHGRQAARGLVFTHVLTEAEAQVIRRHHSGHLWHLTGPVSAVVDIRRGELLVTLTPGGDRHLLDPLEALSEVLLAGEIEKLKRREAKLLSELHKLGAGEA